jgi:hypothetical protein
VRYWLERRLNSQLHNYFPCVFRPSSVVFYHFIIPMRVEVFFCIQPRRTHKYILTARAACLAEQKFTLSAWILKKVAINTFIPALRQPSRCCCAAKSWKLIFLRHQISPGARCCASSWEWKLSLQIVRARADGMLYYFSARKLFLTR